MSEGPARRAVLRWALRLLRREWRQQVLVLALVAVTTGAAVFTVTAAHNMTSRPDADYGTADHLLVARVTSADDLHRYLTEAEAWFGQIDVIGHRSVPVPGSTEDVDVRSQDPDGAFGSTMLAVRDGRFPTGDDEIALTDDVAALLGAQMGDTLELDRRTWRVVGVVENPHDLAMEFALVSPSTGLLPDTVSVLVRTTDDHIRSFAPTEADATRMFTARSEDERRLASVLVLVAATIAMLLVSLVAAAGFTTVAQRRLRQLGMFAAVGASDRHLRRVLVANGVAVGVLGAAAGAILAMLGWLAFAPTLETAAGHRIDRADVPAGLVALALALAVATTTMAAWWPARTVARTPVVQALSARPRRPGAVHRSALVAAVLLVAGVAGLAFGNDPTRDEVTPLVFVPGLVATAVAVVALAAPAIRALAALAGRLPVAARLAVRDLARYQARAASALAAISLGLGIAVSAVVIASAAEYGADEGNVPSDQVIVWIRDERDDFAVPERSPAELAELESTIDDIGRALDGAAVVPLEVAVTPAEESDRGEALQPPVLVARPVSETTLRDVGLAFVATPSLLDHFGIDPDTIEADTILLTSMSDQPHLMSARVPSSASAAVQSAVMTLLREGVPDEQVQRIDVPDYGSTPRSVVTEHGLAVGGWRAAPAGWLLDHRGPITDAQLADARDRAAAAGLIIESRDPQTGLVTVRTVASVAGILLALGIMAMTVGLIRGETAGDVRTLTATGATSRTRRALAASTSGALALLAVLLGTGVAYVPLVAGYWPDAGRLHNIPMLHLLAIVVGVPLLAAGCSWLLGGREPPGLARSALE